MKTDVGRENLRICWNRQEKTEQGVEPMVTETITKCIIIVMLRSFNYGSASAKHEKSL